MKYTQTKRLSNLLKAAIVLLLSAFLALIGVGRYELNASAATGDVIEIQRYESDLTIRTDRKVEVKERITVKFLATGLTMFYRSLPLEGAKYQNVTASCDGNAEFSYYVDDNPDVSGFLDVNCVGGAKRGNVWTYDISYTMENDFDGGDGMTIDAIPFGFTVPLHNVTATLHFPVSLTAEDCDVYVGYGSTELSATEKVFSDDGKTLTVSAEILEVRYNDTYGENVADGITVDFRLGEGVLDGYTKTRIFTDNMWWILLVGGVAVAIAVVLTVCTRKKREISTVVNIKAPDNMDPLKMGKLIDGNVDGEDITSMIYYFADKGYLAIDLTDEDDPKFIRKREELPDGAPPYQKTLFDGIFEQGEEVRVSDLKNHFYSSADKAMRQVPPTEMYEPSSRFAFFAGGVLGTFFALLVTFLLGKFYLGGGYGYFLGAAFAVPVAAILFLAYMRENYRYKWSKAKLTGLLLAELLVAALFTLLYVGVFAKHLTTGYERLAVSLAAFGCTFIGIGAISRTERYCERLGEILGFKEFIVVTETDRIKFMLEENPDLYYKILPYAQVLGVTKEWEEKFEKILVEPPQWCVGSNMTVFDYLIINRCMRAATIGMMTRPQPKGGGSFTGRSGGGGHFGGFGGGGFGGGGGGAR